MASESSNSVYYSGVKWSMKDFFAVIQRKICALPSTDDISKEDWIRVADAVSRTFEDNCDVLLLNNSYNFYLNEAECKIAKAFQASEKESNPKIDLICDRVAAIFLETFKAIQPRAWTTNEDAAFLELYREFLTRHAPSNSSYKELLLKNWPARPSYGPAGFDLSDINRELSLAEVRQRYLAHGGIQLRQIDPDATILILGCGNGRISDDGSYPVEWEDFEQAAYSLDHNHSRKIVTVDLALDANPTICLSVGCQLLAPAFRGQKFKLIVVEGVGLNLKASPFKGDLEQLMAPGCVVIEEADLLEQLKQNKAPASLDASYFSFRDSL